MAPRFIDCTTDVSSRRQAHAAIEHYEKQNFECAITLAAAAEGMLPPTDKPYFHQKIKEISANLKDIAEGSTGANDVITWLKHGTFKGEKCSSAQIQHLEVLVTIYRAISKYIAVYGDGSPQMISFMRDVAKQLKSEETKNI
jgi:hypothetical protein